MNRSQELAEQDAVYDKWGNRTKYIKSYFINRQPHELRFVERDGKKILQQELLVKVYFSEGVWSAVHQYEIHDEIEYVWFDIPLEE